MTLTRHLRVDGPNHDDRLDLMAQGVLGQPLNRLEGPLKVTGRAKDVRRDAGRVTFLAGTARCRTACRWRVGG